jgi:hypothetical protein
MIGHRPERQKKTCSKFHLTDTCAATQTLTPVRLVAGKWLKDRANPRVCEINSGLSPIIPYQADTGLFAEGAEMKKSPQPRASSIW